MTLARLGLRGQLLVALLFVTLGAILSVGAISVSQTRQALAVDRAERVAALTASAGLLLWRTIDPARPVDDHPNRSALRAARGQIALAVSAEALAFFDAHRRTLDPTGAPMLGSDERGVAAALAGAAPHAEGLGGGRLVAYAAIGPVGHAVGVVRAVFALDAAVDATLARARGSVIILSIIDGLVLLVAASLLLGSAVVRPVADLTRAARKVASGDLSARVESRGPGELGQLAEAFDRMTASLRTGRESLIRSEKLASVGRLAAGVAHEVGNPLAAILGYAEMLLSEGDGRPLEPTLRHEILVRVRAETQRIDRIVRELLAYARPPLDEPEAVALGPVVALAVSLAAASARASGVVTRVDVPEDLPPVRGQSGRLTQVLLNLLLNAADATAGRGTIVVAGRRAGDRVVLSVSDDGPGIPPDIRDCIFDPFFTTKDPGAGTGLGLSVSQTIVEACGGSLRLADSPVGARFEVELKVAEAANVQLGGTINR